MKLYKYCQSSIINKAFEIDGYVTLKCELPKNYNDPYELFLSINPDGVDESVLAFYNEAVRTIPQLPTTCFSRRPDIIPMWAHYGQEHKGFVIELDEESLSNHIELGYISNVDYSSSTGSIDLGLIQYACTTLKPRHVKSLQDIACAKAYFTKNECWAYEQERRLVVSNRDIIDTSGMLILKLPITCVTSIIIGPKAFSQDYNSLMEIAHNNRAKLLQMKLSSTNYRPYFVDGNGKTEVFDGKEIIPKLACSQCGEPIDCDNLCWLCSLSEEEKSVANMNNPINTLNMFGITSYNYVSFRDITQIGRLSQKNSHPTPPTNN